MEGGTRILVAFLEGHRIYQETTAAIIREFRPHVEISVTDLDELEAEVERLRPDLVICSRFRDTVTAAQVHAWLKLPTGHNRTAELCLDGEYSEVEDPGLDELLWVVDETERLVQAKGRPGNC